MKNLKSWTDRIGMISGLEEILTRPIPVPKLVLDPWLAEGESALIHAAAGVGKTLLAQSLALAASTGGSVLNTQGTGVPVLYIDGEMGEDAFQARANLLCDGMETEVQDARFDLIQSSACPPEGVGVFPYLDKEENREQLKKLVVDH